ncbi:hypothetical protein BH23ACT10_BH23ACT10_20240 [soil metagenome]
MTIRRLVAACLALAAGVLWWRLRPDGHQAPQHLVAVAEPRAIGRLASWRPAPPDTTVGRVAAYLWAGPLTAVGLLLGALSRTRPTVHDGVLLFAHARGVGGWMLRWRGFAAATLGHTILAAGQPGDRLLQHELVHVRQAERWGPLFVPLYLAGLMRYGYRRNPLERAAYGPSDGPMIA